MAVQAQQVEICRHISLSGQAVSPGERWMIEEEGGYLSAVFHAAAPLRDTVIGLKVESYYLGEWSETYSKFQHVYGDTWLAWQFQVFEAGRYRAVVITGDSSRLAEKEFRVMIHTGEGIRVTADTFQIEIGSADSSVSSAGRMSGADSIRVKVRGASTLNTRTLICDVWTLSPSGQYEFRFTDKFKVEPEWEVSWFKLPLPSEGKYLITLYDEDQVYRGHAAITRKQEGGVR